jgi:DNA-binding CsgD family transcriptional regulator
MTNKEIAQKLCISPATVRTHLYNLFQKIDVTNRIELLNSLYDQHE